MNFRLIPKLLSLLYCVAMLASIFAASASAQVNHDDRGRWHHSEYLRRGSSSTYNPNLYAGRNNAYFNGYDAPYYSRGAHPQSYYGYADPYSYGYGNAYGSPQMQHNYRPQTYAQPYYATPYSIRPGYAPYSGFGGYGSTWGW